MYLHHCGKEESLVSEMMHVMHKERHSIGYRTIWYNTPLGSRTMAIVSEATLAFAPTMPATFQLVQASSTNGYLCERNSDSSSQRMTERMAPAT